MTSRQPLRHARTRLSSRGIAYPSAIRSHLEAGGMQEMEEIPYGCHLRVSVTYGCLPCATSTTSWYYGTPGAVRFTAFGTSPFGSSAQSSAMSGTSTNIYGNQSPTILHQPGRIWRSMTGCRARHSYGSPITSLVEWLAGLFPGML